MKGNFENSLSLTWFMLKRERIVSSVWIAGLVVAIVGLVPGMREALDADSQIALFAMLENPSLVAMMGPPYALINETFGSLYTSLMLLICAFTVGLMNVFLVIRHTRADEEKWRYEVVRSLPVGRLANLNAALITAVIVNVILAVLIGLGMYAFGDSSMDFNGSMLWGAALGVTGLVFAAIAALFSQLCSNSRSAIGYSFGALMMLYLLRAPGDMEIRIVSGSVVTGGSEGLALFSPLGLVLRTQAYAGDFWWPIFVLLGVTAVIVILAFYFNSIRDIDQGLIPARRGRSEGSALVRTPFGLSFKLLRTGIIIWIIGMFSLGYAYGTVAGDVDQFMASNEMWQQLMIGPTGIQAMNDAGLTPDQILEQIRTAVSAMGYTLTELFMSTITNIMGVFTLVPLFLFILRAKNEEKDGRTEAILATPTSRYKYLASFAVIAFISAIVIQFVLALSLYSSAMQELTDQSELSLKFLIEANMVYVPAQWVMLGIAILLIGLVPKATGILWGYFTFTLFFMFFGRMNIFPDWLQKFTPFGYIPQLPMDEINYLTMGILTAVAAALTCTGFILYSKRDINAITH